VRTPALGRKSSEVAKRFPQTAYAGLTKLFQMEWQYLQQVTPPGSALGAFQPIEEAIRSHFIPALLGDSSESTDGERKPYSRPVKFGGLGIPNPTETSADDYSTSVLSPAVSPLHSSPMLRLTSL